MKKYLFALGLLAATPAMASEELGEGHVQLNAGIEHAEGESKAMTGIAAGYDFNLGDYAFAGAEIGLDMVLAHDTKVAFGAVARAGGKLGEANKLYGLAGISVEGSEKQAVYGGGFEHRFGKMIGNLEYRHLDSTHANQFTLGVGMVF